MKIKTLTPWILLAPLPLFLTYGPANGAISTGTGGAAITGAASTIATSDLTASRVLVSNSSGKVAVSTVTSTTLGYLDIGISLTTLLSGKAASSHTHDVSDISGILGSATGGTGNGFTKFTGPTTSEKTYTLPNASATILTSNTAVTVAQGGTGAATLTNHGVLIGQSASAVVATSAGTSGQVLTSNGASADPTFQTLSSATVDPGQTQFRLSLSTGVPVMTSTVSSATTLYAVPYKGNRISLYSGSAWLSYSSAEMSLSLSGYTTGKNYDIFAYDNSGTPTLESLVWTNDSTRATALVAQDGVLSKTGALTRKYLGTIRIGSTGQCNWILPSVSANGTAGLYGVYNYYNRVEEAGMVGDSTDSWTYNTASTWREANGSTTMIIQFIVGVSEDAVEATYRVPVTTAGSSSNAMAGVGLDSTTAKTGRTPEYATVAVSTLGIGGELRQKVAAGWHYVAALEWKAGSNAATFYGDNGGSDIQSGLQFKFLM